MKHIKTQLVLALFAAVVLTGYSQDTDDGGSVIQNLTPSKLVGPGQWDLKLFNNFYTQTRSTFDSDDGIRQNLFTSTFEAFVGVSPSRRINVGIITEYRANGRDFIIREGGTPDGEIIGTERRNAQALTSIAPSIKFVPFKSVGNFSILSSLSIPLISQEESDDDVFIDQNGFTWQNRFFYDYTFPGKTWQIFAEVNSEYNFGEAPVEVNGIRVEGSFANNSLRLTPGVFLSYFPSSKFTIQGLIQHSELIDLGNNFSQSFTVLGGGLKYQLTKELNIEGLYTNFVSVRNGGFGQTFNIGLRAVL